MQTGGQGQVSKRKRIKGKIGDPSSKPELKFCSCVNPTATGAYECEYFPGIHWAAHSGPQMWKPYMLQWPVEGSGSDERVGKRIRVKYLRIKGYGASSPFLIDQVRWRLVLYRTKKNYDEDASGNLNETYGREWLYDLYKKHYDLANTTLAEAQLATVNQYYMSYFNKQNMGDDDCKRRILMKGMFSPSQDIGNFSESTRSLSGTIGNQALAGTLGVGATNGSYQKHFASVDIGHVANMSSMFPIDLTVAMNDNVDVNEYRYLLVFETDCIIGQGPTGDYSREPQYANYIFAILPQIYYTDD